MKNNKKMLQLFTVVALFIAVVGISVGFAAMSTSLEIAGTAKVVPATWDIKFTANTFSANGTGAYKTLTPTMTNTAFTGYDVVVTKPGDKGTYTITVKNNGTIDAKVSTVSLGDALNVTAASSEDEAIIRANIDYTVTWADGSQITAGNELAAGESKDILITVQYDGDATQLPSGNATITGRDLTVLFVQK
ncbi:MAG: DUF11 domain-containing protein [Bacilli bacterium]|nr:DUF11 domain-containing protein [Bacilli bacterium]